MLCWIQRCSALLSLTSRGPGRTQGSHLSLRIFILSLLLSLFLCWKRNTIYCATLRVPERQESYPISFSLCRPTTLLCVGQIHTIVCWITDLGRAGQEVEEAKKKRPVPYSILCTCPILLHHYGNAMGQVSWSPISKRRSWDLVKTTWAKFTKFLRVELPTSEPESVWIRDPMVCLLGHAPHLGIKNEQQGGRYCVFYYYVVKLEN